MSIASSPAPTITKPQSKLYFPVFLLHEKSEMWRFLSNAEWTTYAYRKVDYRLFLNEDTIIPI